MEINELKTKFEELKKRLSVVEKAATIAETQKTALVDRIKNEYNIKPEEIKTTIETMNADILSMKENLTTALTAFEETLTKVEKTINE